MPRRLASASPQRASNIDQTAAAAQRRVRAAVYRAAAQMARDWRIAIKTGDATAVVI